MGDNIIFDGNSQYGRYQVADVIYAGRPARVLYSDGGDAAQSGIALDEHTELLFDYNRRFIELLRGLGPERILMIGGGAFTLPSAVQRELPDVKMDIVELDPMLLIVAMTYFNFAPTPRTKIYLEDGVEFLKRTARKYDAIIVDVFVRAAVPHAFQTVQVAQQYYRLLHPHGLVAMNAIGHYFAQHVSPELRHQLLSFRTVFQDAQIFPAAQYLYFWLPQNFIIIAQRQPREITWMRSRSVSTLVSLSV